MTNGEVFQKIFPCEEIHINGLQDGIVHFSMTSNLKSMDCFSLEWWNAEYNGPFAIPEKEKRTDDKWILVSERLPECRICEDGWEDPSDYVMVVMASGYMHITRYWSKQSEVWIDLDYPTTDEVVAWRPLPEPFIDPNDMTHIFDGLKEIPEDFFKGWSTDALKNMEDDKK